MPKTKLSQPRIEAKAYKPETGKPVTYFADTQQPGLLLQVQASGAYSYVIPYRFQGKSRKLTLKGLPSIDVARKEARAALDAVAQGGDPAGEKKAEKEDKQKDYRVVERSYGSFYRAFELPAGVETDKIKADISKGVLKVTVPKPAAKQVTKIDVKAAA